MKISTWTPIAKRLVTAMESPAEWEIRGRLIYRRSSRFVVSGLLADNMQYKAGPRLWRVRLALFDGTGFMALGWSERLGDFGGLPNDLAHAEFLARESLGGIGSEEDDLRWITTARSYGPPDSLEQACAFLALGDYRRFRDRLKDPDLRVLSTFRSAEVDRQEVTHFARLAEIESAAADQAAAFRVLTRWRDEGVRALQESRKLGPVEPSATQMNSE